MKRIISIFVAVSFTIIMFSVNASAAAEAVVGGTLAGLESIFGIIGGSMFGNAAASGNIEDIRDFETVGSSIGWDISNFTEYRNSVEAGTYYEITEEEDLADLTSESSKLYMKWFLEEAREYISLDGFKLVITVPDEERTALTPLQIRCLEIVAEAFNSAADETGNGYVQGDTIVYDGYIRDTGYIQYDTYKCAINKAIAMATGQDTTNIFAKLAADGTVSRTISIEESAAIYNCKVRKNVLGPLSLEKSVYMYYIPVYFDADDNIIGYTDLTEYCYWGTFTTPRPGGSTKVNFHRGQIQNLVSGEKLDTCVLDYSFDYSSQTIIATASSGEYVTSTSFMLYGGTSADSFQTNLDTDKQVSYVKFVYSENQADVEDFLKALNESGITSDDFSEAVSSNVLNLPVSLIELATLTKAAEQGLTDDELNPVITFTTDIDTTTGAVTNTDVAVGDDVISGAGAGEQDRNKDLVYVPTGVTDLSGSLSIGDVKYEIETPSVIVYKFPFSLPFDVYNIFNLLSATPEAPRFSIPLQSSELGINETIDVDLSEYDWIAEIVRWFVYATFCVGIIKLTNNLIGRGG